MLTWGRKAKPILATPYKAIAELSIGLNSAVRILPEKRKDGRNVSEKHLIPSISASGQYSFYNEPQNRKMPPNQSLIAIDSYRLGQRNL